MAYPRGVRPHSGKIEIRWQINARRYSEFLDLTPTRSNLTQAARIRKARIEAVKYGLPIGDGNMTFAEVAQAYLDNAEIELSTRNSYRDAINIYWAALASKDIATISTAELIELDEAIDWTSRKTRANALIPLRRVFRYAVSRGLLISNPGQALQSRRDRQPSTPDPYTATERDKLLGWLRLHGTSPSWEYFTLAFHSGARTSELLALRWQDFDGTSIYIERAFVRRAMKGTKTGIARRVILTDDAIEALRSMPRPINGGAIFRNQYGRSFQSAYHLNKTFRRAHESMRIRHRKGPYPWRHTYASLGLTAGVKPAFLAKQLGHSLNVLLKTYARWIDDDGDRAELARLNTLSSRMSSK